MILIIQTGDPVELAKPYGSFAEYFVNGMALQLNQVKVVSVHHGEVLPKCNAAVFSGVVITGSAAMVTDNEGWMLATKHWLEQAIKQEIPVLGVCFGHQLLADMLGGQVCYNPKGRNMGHSVCHLTQAGVEDPILGKISTESHFNTLVSHQQVVLQLPKTTQRLAYCDMDENHAFRYQNHVWGVQFHPEWTVAIMQAYIKQREPDLQAEGHDVVVLSEELKPSLQARQLLVNFKNLALQSHQTSAL